MRIFLDTGVSSTTSTARNSFPQYVIHHNNENNNTYSNSSASSRLQARPPQLGLSGRTARMAGRNERFTEFARNIPTSNDIDDDTSNEKLISETTPRQLPSKYRLDQPYVNYDQAGHAIASADQRPTSAKEISRIQQERTEYMQKKKQEREDETIKRDEQKLKIEQTLRKKFPAARVLKSQAKYDATRRKQEEDEQATTKVRNSSPSPATAARKSNNNSPDQATSQEAQWFSKLIKNPQSITYENGKDRGNSSPSSQQQHPETSSSNQNKLIISELRLLGGPKILPISHNEEKNFSPNSGRGNHFSNRPVSASSSYSRSFNNNTRNLNQNETHFENYHLLMTLPDGQIADPILGFGNVNTFYNDNNNNAESGDARARVNKLKETKRVIARQNDLRRQTRLDQSRQILEDALRIGESSPRFHGIKSVHGVELTTTTKAASEIRNLERPSTARSYSSSSSFMIAYDCGGGRMLSRNPLGVSGQHVVTPGPRPSSARIARGAMMQDQQQERNAADQVANFDDDADDGVFDQDGSSVLQFASNDDPDIHPVTRKLKLKPGFVTAVPGVFGAGLMCVPQRNKQVADSCLAETSQYHPLNVRKMTGIRKKNLVLVPEEFNY